MSIEKTFAEGYMKISPKLSNQTVDDRIKCAFFMGFYAALGVPVEQVQPLHEEFTAFAIQYMIDHPRMS